MTVKHDPTPWQLEGGHQWLSTTHPSPLFELVPIVGYEDEHKANAEFIVKACNAYETMRGALEQIANAPAWGAPERWETTPAEVRQLARAALTLDDSRGAA